MTKISPKTLILFPIVLIFYEFAINLSNDMYLPALVEIGKSLNTNDNLVQLTITAWLAGSASLQLIFGPISDRYGRRPILFLGGIIFVIATLGCALAPGISWLLGYRFFQGMAVSSLMVTGYASIHELYGEKRATRVLSWLYVAAIVAPMIGPLLGSYVMLLTSWRMIFYFLVVLSLISLVGLYFVMPESNLTTSPIHPKHVTLTYFRIIKNKNFLMLALPTSLLYTGLIIWITGSPFLIIQKMGFTPQDYGYLQIPIFFSYIIGSQFMKILTHSVKLRSLATFGLTLSTISSIVLVLLNILTLNLYTIIIPMCFYATGCGFANAPMTRLTLSSSGEKLGTTTALFYLKLAGIGALGSLAVTIFYNSTAISITALIGTSVIIAWIIFILNRKRLKTM